MSNRPLRRPTEAQLDALRRALRRLGTTTPSSSPAHHTGAHLTSGAAENA